MSKNTETQRKKILAALLSGKKLTPMDALKKYHCMRLGARIWSLRQDGHNIETQMVSVRGGDGHVAAVAQYFIKPTTKKQTKCKQKTKPASR